MKQKEKWKVKTEREAFKLVKVMHEWGYKTRVCKPINKPHISVFGVRYMP